MERFLVCATGVACRIYDWCAKLGPVAAILWD
jgi:hypothetical protein